MQKERICYFDFIRALSTISIIIFHFNCSLAPHMVYGGDNAIILYNYKNGNLGQIGVSLFFILSGASLMYNYGDKLSLKKYYTKRWLAIFPMFYLAWISATLFYMFRFFSLNPFCVDREPWTITLTILGLDGYLCSLIPNYYLLGEWFLGCILIMYVFFPLIRFLFKKVNPWFILFGYAAIYLLIVANYNLDFSIEYFVFTRLLEFIFGMFLIEHGNKVNTVSVLISGSVVTLWNCVYINIPQMCKTTIMGISLYIILMFIGQKLDKNGNFFFRYVSKLSYAIFLCHHIVIDQICTRFDGRMYGKHETYVILLMSFIMIFFVATLLYNLHEKTISFFCKKDNSHHNCPSTTTQTKTKTPPNI